MPTIRIDDDIYEYLKAQAKPFVETEPNAVLRRLLLGEGKNKKAKTERVERAPLRSVPTAETDAFLRRVLKDRFGGGFKSVANYRYMFESGERILYFQNFNKSQATHLWYRLRETAFSDLMSSRKAGFVCFTNPAEGILYVLPVAEIRKRQEAMGWKGGDMEVNIDPAADRWRELDWDISRYLVREGG